jgi:peptidoglycan/xylan/chitin deacetylase (PgdA/CDA1 family)
VRLLTIFFDLETPFLWKDAPKFDQVANMKDICRILDGFGIRAVINICGIVAEEFPDLLARLHADGHEIASHGYKHENFAMLGTDELNKTLLKTEEILAKVTGETPIGIRSPWLIRSKRIYSTLRSRGYKWTSNWNVPYPSLSRTGRGIHRVRWMLHKKKPFEKHGLLEIPLLSPLDIYCIHPFPEVWKASSEDSLEQAFRVLVGHYNASKEFYNLNFHPQIIGTMNRLILLERILGYLSNQSGVKFILPHELCGAS